VPAVAAAVPTGIATLDPMEYRNPDHLPPGGVLVVGASATGIQIADEVHRSGRPVTLSVGEHVRVPRLYRGQDIQWWMETTGILDERIEEMDNPIRARSLPSLQLAGSPERRALDLNVLTDAGVRLVGRLAGIRGSQAQFSGSLKNQCSLADLKMNRLLDRIDEWVEGAGLAGEVPPAHRFEPTRLETSPPLGLDLASGEIRTIVWATGFRPDYSWLHVPVLDPKGRIRHDRGIVEAPGLYVTGIPFLRRRKSSLIDGAGQDARELSEHLAGFLAGSHSAIPA
jgi:putative flavoprotein involved in K+ transport